jgi:hypothetical protein
MFADVAMRVSAKSVSLVLLVLTSMVMAGCGKVEAMRAEQAAKDRIVPLLRDPESAKFGEDFIVANEGLTPLVCGEVNAKNGFGGYTGLQTFMIWQDQLHIASSEEESAALAVCCLMVVNAAELKTATWNDPRFKDGCGAVAEIRRKGDMRALPFDFSQY